MKAWKAIFRNWGGGGCGGAAMGMGWGCLGEARGLWMGRGRVARAVRAGARWMADRARGRRGAVRG